MGTAVGFSEREPEPLEGVLVEPRGEAARLLVAVGDVVAQRLDDEVLENALSSEQDVGGSATARREQHLLALPAKDETLLLEASDHLARGGT